MAILSKGKEFATGNQVTAADLNALVDNGTFAAGAVDNTTTALDGSSPARLIVKNAGISSTQLATNSVTTVKIQNNAISLAKMATQADQTVLGNVSGGSAVPTAVPIVGAAGILINDDALGTSDTKGATQGNIKAYVDSFSLKYSGDSGTFSTNTSYQDLDLSSVVGSNRAMVIMEVFDKTGTFTNDIFFRTKGSSADHGETANSAGWGASGASLSTTNGGGTIVVITDSSGVIEHTADGTMTGINYVIQAYQKLT